MQNTMEEQHIVGKTKDRGFQIGVRKTFPISLEQAWKLIVSPEGIRLWLGDVDDFYLVKGHIYQTRDGASGKVGVVNFRENIRLTWQPPQWSQASTIQVRVIPSRNKTVIGFHQEQLAGPLEREQMRQRWARVLDELQALL
ncbi:MAG: ATPase [Chloroflexi bacterium HGW-Chloroflexi-10]|nr:MAG: ATPase [Chloroflexi bacterium HGW-Chloroflexi-10]